jgi:hypothetical protein
MCNQAVPRKIKYWLVDLEVAVLIYNNGNEMKDIIYAKTHVKADECKLKS